MLVYIILFTFITFITCFINTKKSTKNRKIYITLAFGAMAIVGALRKYTIGIDLQILYYPKYIQLVNVSFSNLFSSSNLETGYLLFCKLLTLISKEPQTLIIVTSIITTSITGWFIYKYSNNVKCSTILYIILNIYFMSMNIIRQQLAVSILLIAFHYWMNNKKLKGILIALLASTFHSSAIIVLPVLLLYGMKFKKNYLYLSAGISLFLMVTYKYIIKIYSIISSILHLSNNKDYASYLENEAFGIGTVNINNILSVALAIIFFCIAYYYIIFINKTKDETQLKRQHFYLFMAAFYMIINIVALKMVIISRLQYYFLPFILLIIPESISLLTKNKNKLLIIILLFSILLFRFTYVFFNSADDLYGVTPYKFFWE